MNIVLAEIFAVNGQTLIQCIVKFGIFKQVDLRHLLAAHPKQAFVDTEARTYSTTKQFLDYIEMIGCDRLFFYFDCSWHEQDAHISGLPKSLSLNDLDTFNKQRILTLNGKVSFTFEE